MSIINLIIKPTDACNLNCKYCYHAASHKGGGGMINMQYIEKLLALCADNYDMIQIVWHGGEPLIAGIDFFKAVIKLQKKFRKEKNCCFTNSIQTNGTLIDGKWIRFFRKNRFSIGISYDGETNEESRSETETVLKVLKLLKKRHIPFGILSVITKENLDQVHLYEVIKEYSATAKFNPVFSPDGTDKDYLVDCNEYIDSLKKLWDVWAFDIKGILVEPLITYTSKLMGIPGVSACSMNSCLGKWIDMDYDGTLRFCGQSGDSFFVIGNIESIGSIAELFNSDKFNTIVSEAIMRRNACKDSCEYFKLCQGGCICRAHIEGGVNKQNGFSCTTTKAMLTYIRNSLHDILSSGFPLDKLNPILKNIVTSSFALSNDFEDLLGSQNHPK